MLNTQRIKNHLARWRFLFSAAELRRTARASWAGLEQRRQELQLVHLRPLGPVRGHVLFSYRIEGFLLPAGHPVLRTHTNYWRSVQMAQTFLDLGFAVDVIDYRNDRFEPEQQYDVLVDVRHNLERLAKRVGPKCIKIFHIDTAHILHHNAAEAARLVQLQIRKGVTIRPWRWEQPNFGIDCADCATASVVEGEFAISTYAYAGKPIYTVPVPVSQTFPWPTAKNWEQSRNRFLWYGSGGLVHKGLDVTLDAFAQMPECHLTVCAPLQDEKTFAQAYAVELKGSPNIEPLGWIEFGGEKFRQVTDSCIGLVFPSASESCSASSIECMHAGLIPILSREAGVPVRDFGIVLQNSSVGEIQAAVRRIKSLPAAELEARARQAWDYVRRHHTRERFAQVYKDVISQILVAHGKSSISTSNVQRSATQASPGTDDASIRHKREHSDPLAHR